MMIVSRMFSDGKREIDGKIECSLEEFNDCPKVRKAFKAICDEIVSDVEEAKTEIRKDNNE